MTTITTTLLAGAFLAVSVSAAPASGDAVAARNVDTLYPYTGPSIPVADWVDSSINGVPGKGFPRLVEPPAVTPATKNATNNINVISLSYIPSGVNIHYQVSGWRAPKRNQQSTICELTHAAWAPG